MTKEEETASIIVGVGFAIAVIVLSVFLGLLMVFSPDEPAHQPSEWSQKK